MGFAYRWSSSNRDYKPDIAPIYEGEIKNNVESWAESFAASAPGIDYIVLGHHHVAVDKRLATGARLVILGDWIYNFTYGVFDGNTLQLKQYVRAKEEFNKTSHI